MYYIKLLIVLKFSVSQLKLHDFLIRWNISIWSKASLGTSGWLGRKLIQQQIPFIVYCVPRIIYELFHLNVLTLWGKYLYKGLLDKWENQDSCKSLAFNRRQERPGFEPSPLWFHSLRSSSRFVTASPN